MEDHKNIKRDSEQGTRHLPMTKTVTQRTIGQSGKPSSKEKYIKLVVNLLIKSFKIIVLLQLNFL